MGYCGQSNGEKWIHRRSWLSLDVSSFSSVFSENLINEGGAKLLQVKATQWKVKERISDREAGW